MSDTRFWETKLAARIHDPFEKALVLLLDSAGHEGGTVRQLGDLLDLPHVDSGAVRRADWWASAADRPQWPRELSATVRWYQRPVLIHPLSGEQIDLSKAGGLGNIDIETVKSRSRQHFVSMVEAVGKEPRKTLLAFWRFGPELTGEDDNEKLGALWRLLPADTRVPDHSIADHLDLTSAFAGAFVGDPNGKASLLALAIGPVQPFIAAARSTSDLWAGSHLLSRLAWEAMKPLVEELGPDAVLFPRLRGIPQVDLWLRDECGLPSEWFERCGWNKGSTDANPLFSAALPNRFVAVVPASRARELAEQCKAHVRGWLQEQGRKVVDRLLEVAQEEKRENLYCYEQMRGQLAGFPEVHWAAVSFSLVRPRNEPRQTDLDVEDLTEAMAPFFGVAPDEPAGFLATEAWQVLRKEIQWEDGTRFFLPNPGVLYPAVYNLAERVLAAAKSVRAFGQSPQKGWRCSLTGETEWLTTDPEQLQQSYRRQTNTLWAKVAKARLAWAKKGEHLGGLPAIKRLWPTLFAEEVGKALGKDTGRFVVSTHTMALVRQLDRWLKEGGEIGDALRVLLEAHCGDQPDRIALPTGFVNKHHHLAFSNARRILGLMERAGETDDEQERDRVRRAVEETLNPRGAGDGFRLETYYGLLLLDGDHMGRILSGGGEHAVTYRESFHPDIRARFDQHAENNARLRRYADQKRAVSPNRHLAVSGALNDFSQHIVPYVVEREYLGKVIYAGGDDVLAMLPTADLLPTAQRLRRAYSGTDPEHEGGRSGGLALQKGFAWLDGRLYRMMGERATASAGLVVAHHQAPLGRILRELREAESIAKQSGRNCFHLRVIKRSGGALSITLPWGAPLDLLESLRRFLADPAVSRRAVYNTLDWLKDIPVPDDGGEMLSSLLAYQLARQSDNKAAVDHFDVSGLARRLAILAAEQDNSLDWLANFLSIGEFLARETRTGGGT